MESVKIISATKTSGIYRMMKTFLQPYEKFACQLMEFLNQKDKDVLAVVNEIGDDVLVCGIFYYSKGGLVLPFFIEKTSAVEQILRDFFCEHRVFCVSGEKSSTDFIVGAVLSSKKQSEKESREFDLMESRGTVRDISMDGYRFRQCTRDDSDFLYPLQVSYIKEEVLPDGMELNLPAERLAMDKILKTGKIYAVTDLSGKIVCKAQINGETDSCVLVGGVFTAEPYRKKGLAAFMMENLKSLFAQKNKSCTLFVNHRNYAAAALYKKTSFKNFGTYRIVYMK